MTIPDKIAFKNTLRQVCVDTIGERIAAAKAGMENAQASANQEEKSSAGDKYETGRAMGHLEKELHSRQLSENLKELALLHGINTSVLYPTATTGAFVECEEESFFLAAGLGKQTVDGRIILFLSPHAPLSKLLLDKKAGDSFPFKGTSQVIKEVF